MTTDEAAPADWDRLVTGDDPTEGQYPPADNDPTGAMRLAVLAVVLAAVAFGGAIGGAILAVT